MSFCFLLHFESKKVSSLIAQYPVIGTAQNALHFSRFISSRPVTLQLMRFN